MQPDKNSLGQVIGFPVPDWKPVARPTRKVMTGHFCRLEPLDATRHAADLYAANALDAEGRNWTYLPYGPFDSPEQIKEFKGPGTQYFPLQIPASPSFFFSVY